MRIQTPRTGPLIQVWNCVREAKGAVTYDFVARRTGLEPDLVRSILTWLVRQGHIQRVGEGEVCAIPQKGVCRWCAWRPRCPAAAE